MKTANFPMISSEKTGISIQNFQSFAGTTTANLNGQSSLSIKSSSYLYPKQGLITKYENGMGSGQKQAVAQKYAIIIPCYNEEKRFPFQQFLSFSQNNPEVLLCFVNDGSKDKTLSVLNGIQVACPENICVYSLAQNSGKSEAVRQGMLHVHCNNKAELLGFLDADLATTPEEWLQMAKYKEQHNRFGAIVGSRIQRLGADINRDDSRSLFSSIIKKCIRMILKTPFQDTQCGAKIFSRALVPFLFNQSFMTPWLFDVEIFLRLQKKFGKTTLQKGVLEFPLMHWTEVGDSRLKLKHTIKIPFQLIKLYYNYNLASK